jgi:Transcriptional regulator, AbiEi antitoxin
MGSDLKGVAQRVLWTLPATFTYSQARRSGVSDRALYGLRDAGMIENIGRGLYHRTDLAALPEIDLVEIARRAPDATLCLTSALARHGLTDEIPATIDAALPRGRHRPATSAPVTWHMFDAATFDIGRDEVMLADQTAIGLYGPERSIVDAMRLRHREGSALGITALRRWLRRPGSSPSALLQTASRFPSAEKALRQALEILL